jgi:hypothetical protein
LDREHQRDVPRINRNPNVLVTRVRDGPEIER